jgi:hypothetical protein
VRRCRREAASVPVFVLTVNPGRNPGQKHPGRNTRCNNDCVAPTYDRVNVIFFVADAGGKVKFSVAPLMASVFVVGRVNCLLDKCVVRVNHSRAG